MKTLGPFEMVIVVVKGEGLGDEFIGGGPVAEGIVEVILSAEEVDAEGFGFGEANEGGVGVAAADIGEATHPREDFAELVGAFPGGGEGADASRGTSCEGDVLGFGAPSERETAANFGENFGEQEAAVGIAKGIVFEAAVGGFVVGFLIGFAARVDEDTDDRGHVTFVDEVVKNDRDAEASVGVGMASAVLPDHEAEGLIGLMIGGGVNGDLADGIGEDLAVFPFECLEGAFGDVGMGEAFGGGLEMFDANLATLLNASINEDAIIGFGEVGEVEGEDLQAIGTDLNHVAEQFAIFANDAGGFFGEGCPSDGGAFDLGGGAIVDEGLVAEEANDFAMEALLFRGIHGGGQGSEQGLW